MPLASVQSMLSRARKEGFAVGYFESWNIESLQGVIDAAEKTRSPVIVGFNGEFLSAEDRMAEERLAWYAALGRAAAESASVPCGLIFNECARDDWVERAVDLGFGLDMPADAEAPLPEYTARVKALASRAHAAGAAIEAELGELPLGAGRGDHGDGQKTDPDAAAAFVRATGVDLQAVSVGNVHVNLEGRQGLDLELLRRIAGGVPVPLVLHGGTGIESGNLGEAIQLGVAKVNYGTYLKQAYLAAVRDALEVPEANPHALLGMGGPRDVMTAGRMAVCNAVMDRIGLLGCVGKADEKGQP